MTNQPRLIAGADGQTRCWWCGNDPLYVAFHDREWGVQRERAKMQFGQETHKYNEDQKHSRPSEAFRSSTPSPGKYGIPKPPPMFRVRTGRGASAASRIASAKVFSCASWIDSAFRFC